MADNSTSKMLAVLSKLNRLGASEKVQQEPNADVMNCDLTPAPEMDEVLAHILRQSLSKKNTPMD